MWHIYTMEYYSAIKINKPSSHKKKRTLINSETIWRSYVTVWFQLYNILGKQNCGESKKISGCQRSGNGEEMLNRWYGTQKIFRAAKLLYIILCWWICIIIHSSKPIECKIPRVNPNVNYGLWVIMLCRYRFIDWVKCTTVVWSVDSRGSCG